MPPPNELLKIRVCTDIHLAQTISHDEMTAQLLQLTETHEFTHVGIFGLHGVIFVLIAPIYNWKHQLSDFMYNALTKSTTRTFIPLPYGCYLLVLGLSKLDHPEPEPTPNDKESGPDDPGEKHTDPPPSPGCGD